MFPSTTKNNTPLNLAVLAVIMLAVVLCIWPGMHSALFTDDIHQLDKSMHLTSWTQIFKTDVFGFYRPVKNALFLFAAPYQNNLVAWHWIGLVAYLAAIAGVYRIVFICLGSARPALLAACLWALSPTCVSTALWLSCANISIGIVFAAGVFHFHERWATKPSIGPLAASLFFFALALLCYESMIAIPALLFVRDLQQRRLSFDCKTILRYSLYSIVALIFLIVRYQLSAKNVGDHNFHPAFAPDTTGAQLSISSPWFLWRHFLMWIFPFGKIELLGSYAWMRSASVASLVLGYVFLASVLATAALTWKRFPAISYGLLFFVVASLPAGNFLPCFNGPINDAYVTIPSIGLAIAFAAVCELLVREFLKRRREADSGMVAALAVLCLLLVYRVPVCGAYFRYWAGVWANPVELMLLTTETRPFQFQPKAYASVLLFSRGYIDSAKVLAQEVIQEAPWNMTASLTMAKVADYHQDFPLAEEYYRTILNSPNVSSFLKDPAMVGLAQMLANNPARRDEAAQLYREFLQSEKNSHHPDAILLLAKLYQDVGNTAKARATLVRGLSLIPNDDSLKKMLESIDHPVSEAVAH